MHDPVVSFPSPEPRSAHRDALRAAARQLDRARLYLDAVANMGVLDRVTSRSLEELRRDLGALCRDLNERSGRANT